ncbi:MAG TPA: hypothetical protein VIH52_04220 [Candidatus Nanoarchaeia archaeon]
MFLVRTFEERLQVSRREAVKRSIMVALLTLFVAMAGFGWVELFPWAPQTTKTDSFLPVQFTPVESVLGGDVELNRADFLKTVQDKNVFVAVRGNSITYLLKDDDVAYRHYRYTQSPFGYEFNQKYTVENGQVVRHFVRNWGEISMGLIFIPAIVLLVCSFIFYSIASTEEHYGKTRTLFW